MRGRSWCEAVSPTGKRCNRGAGHDGSPSLPHPKEHRARNGERWTDGARDRILFWQTESWCKASRAQGAYSESDCAMCAKPVKPDAAKIRLTRTNDGEWWALLKERDVAEDETVFGHFVLPIGPDCLRRYPGFQPAIVAAPPPDPAVDAAPAAPVVTALTEKQLTEEK